MKVTHCLFCKSSKLSHILKRTDGVDILQCDRCLLMMVANISDKSTLYDSTYFQKDSDSLIGYSNYLSSPVANLMGKYAFAKLIFGKDAGVHLDVGCADGSLIEIFKNEGFNSKGLEISKDAVGIAREKGLEVYVSNLEKFPKGLNQSELITAFDLLEHVKDLSAVMKSIYNNLADDGLFCFSTLSVRIKSPAEYWFSHSLEHYIYFNSSNLSYILGKSFGDNNFVIFETEVNGIAELWGFAKKGGSGIEDERSLIQQIEKCAFDRNDPYRGYLFSLIYNQLAKFDTSSDVINYFKSKFPKSLLTQALFYNRFYQGKLEIAVSDIKGATSVIPANSILWQALSDAEARLAEIQKDQIRKDLNGQIISLREQLFSTREQLHALRNSRVVGRIIKARDALVGVYKIAKSLPHRILRRLKVIIAESTPDPIRKKIRHQLKKLSGGRQPQLVTYSNKEWDSSCPLVSVVTPFYNQDDTIAETVNSVLSQTFADFEYIIVDDGSRVEVEKFVAKYLSDSRLRVIHHKTNLGKGSPAAARNTGVGSAKGKYIVCLDADDSLHPTFLEKAVNVLETNPDASVVTSYMQTHGVVNGVYKHADFDPIKLQKDNMVVTSAAYRREAWSAVGGYKTGIGYEDWEYWLNLSEHGYWGITIHEPLLKYFVAMQSRYMDDKNAHWAAIKVLRDLHPHYRREVSKLLKQRSGVSNIASVDTAFINIGRKGQYLNAVGVSKKNILICMAWMPFGGAESLILNFCRELKDSYNLFFMTGLRSDNEWEGEFQKISRYIYHLPNIVKDESLFNEYICNFVVVHRIDLIHVLHTDFMFLALPRIRQVSPNIKIIITMFNDRVPHYFRPSIDLEKYVDAYTSDNRLTANHYKMELPEGKPVYAIPNGVDSADLFNPSNHNRGDVRLELGLGEKDFAVFFIGRMSEEKNPLAFLESARNLIESNPSIKYFMIGDGPMDVVVDEMIADINSDNIQRLGYRNHTDVAHFLGAADALVLTSTIEGFPAIILEAMSMGVVVVASNVGAIPDVIDNGVDGFVIEAGKADDVSEVLSILDKDRALSEKVKINARKKVDKSYTYQKLKENYLRLYDDVLSDKLRSD